MDNFREIFYQMEEEQDLFNLQLSDGTHYWDIIRRDIHSLLNSNINPLQKGLSIYWPSKKNRSVIETKIRDIVKTGINEISLRYLSLRKPNYIFLTFQRQTKGGRDVDYASDHLYNLVCEGSVCIEHLNQSSICYRDIFLGRKTKIPPVYISSGKKDIEIHGICKEVIKAVNNHFDVSINIYDIVHQSIRVFKEKRNFYRRLFSKFLPKVIIGTDDASYKALYFAAREFKIPTIELQHGISPGNIYHTYSEKFRKPHPGLILPDVFLTLADCWNSENEYPASRTYSIGNDNLYQTPVEGKNNILIVSNLNTHNELVVFTFELSALFKNKKIFYKIHPEQYNYKEEIADVFSKCSNVAVISDEMNNHDMFSNCNHIVGVRSTLLFLALQAGKKVYLYNTQSYNYDTYLLNYVNVELINEATELKNLIDSSANKTPYIPPIFIQQFDPKKFLQILDEITFYK